MRDFAAMQLASILNLSDDRPDKSWSALRWATFRSKVRAQVAAQRTQAAP